MSVIPGLVLTKDGVQDRVFVHPLLLVHLGPLFITYVRSLCISLFDPPWWSWSGKG